VRRCGSSAPVRHANQRKPAARRWRNSPTAVKMARHVSSNKNSRTTKKKRNRRHAAQRQTTRFRRMAAAWLSQRRRTGSKPPSVAGGVGAKNVRLPAVVRGRGASQGRTLAEGHSAALGAFWRGSNKALHAASTFQPCQHIRWGVAASPATANGNEQTPVQRRIPPPHPRTDVVEEANTKPRQSRQRWGMVGHVLKRPNQTTVTQNHRQRYRKATRTNASGQCKQHGATADVRRYYGVRRFPPIRA